MDELPSILQESDLQSFGQEYNIRPDSYELIRYSYELIRCHSYHRADYFFEENDLVMVYEEQLKAGLRFPLDDFFKEVLNFTEYALLKSTPTRGGS